MSLKESRSCPSQDKASIELSNKHPSASVGEANSTLTMTPAEERKLVRKIDLHMMPLMFVLYLLQYLDKTSLGYTAIMGILQDANLSGNQYSWVSSFFYVGFLISSPLSSILLVKFPVAKVVVLTVLIWAGIQMVMAAGKSFASLAVLRILLGAFEAAIGPGFTIITSTWYKPSEHALRHGLWYGGASVAYIIGGIMAYGISHIDSAIKSWQHGAEAVLNGHILEHAGQADLDETDWDNKEIRYSL
ncbi:hypothetical protein FVER53590_11798 [Fusarium verticillioides]|nr:hypothetical protein FVER53590_11798 [Fusarium verticillioides]